MHPGPLKIEELLERMDSREVLGDPAHRYELRRTLLCSRFFDVECARHSRWNRLLSYTAPLVAGGMMVGVFSLLAVSTSSDGAEPVLLSINGEVAESTDEPSQAFRPFVSNPSEPVVQLADINTLDPEESVRFAPLAEHTFVLTQ
ncbi:hypothetical protein HY631_02300 [Candidatus Uhrbacteria bacterium]|nr:hypothetical protein [Candidatus Uhrbacteria bacterium]